MNLYLACLISFLLGLLASAPVFVLAFRRFHRKKVAELLAKEEIHRQEFSQLIHEMNHSGPIPNAATTAGLLGLLTWAISTSIISLEELYEQKNYNTRPISQELRMIALNELALLHKKVSDFLESKRELLRRYDKNQGL